MHIYAIVNRINGKVYIGKTEGPIAKRWSRHLWAAEHKPERMAISQAIAKYGADNFDIYSLFEADSRECLNALECESIEAIGTRNPKLGYNSTRGGDGIPGWTRTEAHLQQMSEAAKRRWSDPEFRSKAILAMRGKPKPKEATERQSAAMKEAYRAGKIKAPCGEYTPQRLQKISENTARLWLDPEYRERTTRAHIGKKRSDSARLKMSETMRRKSSDPAYREFLRGMAESRWKAYREKKAKTCREPQTDLFD